MSCCERQQTAIGHNTTAVFSAFAENKYMPRVKDRAESPQWRGVLPARMNESVRAGGDEDLER
jgi:hypothetical protein